MAFNLEKCGNDVNIQQQGVIKLARSTYLMEQLQSLEILIQRQSNM